MNVLHSVGTFLNVSENWVYPQVVNVPGVRSAVLCSVAKNRELFQLPQAQLIEEHPAWSFAFGVPKVLTAAARRLGLADHILTKRIKRRGISVVHAHFGPRAWEHLRLISSIGLPLVTSFYGYDAWLLPESDPRWRARYKDLFGLGTKFLVEGPSMQARLQDLGCPIEKILIHRIGVDTGELCFQRRPINSLRVMMVGRFVEKKGLVDGLCACREARSRGVDLTVTIIGDASDDDAAGAEIKGKLFEIASSDDLDGRVTFSGFLSPGDTRSVLQSHNVFMSPSRHSTDGDAEGGSPVALTEAMALGLTCIGTRHCDIPEVICSGQTGYVCEEKDVSALASALLNIHADPEAAEGMAVEGRRHVERNFNLAVELKNLSRIYASIS